MSDLIAAPAADKPCQLHRHHAPTVVRTQGHHRHPVYLQNRLYGRIVLPELLWVCGTCHDSIHAWLDWLLRDARRPNPEPGRLVKAEAQRTFAWYQAAVVVKEET